MRFTMKTILAATAALAITAMGGAALAATHTTKELQKMGRAIQYPVRKFGENTSMTTHKALHHNSVKQERNVNARYVVRPNGEAIYKGPNGKILAHRRRHHAS